MSLYRIITTYGYPSISTYPCVGIPLHRNTSIQEHPYTGISIICKGYPHVGLSLYRIIPIKGYSYIRIPLCKWRVPSTCTKHCHFAFDQRQHQEQRARVAFAVITIIAPSAAHVNLMHGALRFRIRSAPTPRTWHTHCICHHHHHDNKGFRALVTTSA